MRNVEECSENEQEEIKTLCGYATIVSNEYAKEIKDKDELWEEQYKLKQIIKKKILSILNK